MDARGWCSLAVHQRESIIPSRRKPPLEVILWAHYSSLPSKSSAESAPDSSVEPGAELSLVQALALLQLKSLQEGASLASLASAAAEVADLPEQCVVVVDGKPLQIPTSDLLSPSPTPLASEPQKTLSSSESGQARNPNGTFGSIEENNQ